VSGCSLFFDKKYIKIYCKYASQLNVFDYINEHLLQNNTAFYFTWHIMFKFDE